MAGEADCDLYGGREELPFAIDVRRNCTVAQLRELLADGAVPHYVGHVDDGGFICSDGVLNPGSLDSVGVDPVLVNGCRSYRAGVALIEAEAVGTVVTVSEVGNADDSCLFQGSRDVADLISLG